MRKRILFGQSYKPDNIYITLVPHLHTMKSTVSIYLGLAGFPGGSDGKESTFNVGDLGLISGSGRSPGEWNGYPL